MLLSALHRLLHSRAVLPSLCSLLCSVRGAPGIKSALPVADAVWEPVSHASAHLHRTAALARSSGVRTHVRPSVLARDGPAAGSARRCRYGAAGEALCRGAGEHRTSRAGHSDGCTASRAERQDAHRQRVSGRLVERMWGYELACRAREAKTACDACGRAPSAMCVWVCLFTHKRVSARLRPRALRACIQSARV